MHVAIDARWDYPLYDSIVRKAEDSRADLVIKDTHYHSALKRAIFSNTGYIDSSGLGVLVSLSKKIRESGGELRLASLNDDLKTLFELTKLDTLFQIAHSRESGLSSF